jgi:acetyl-CoA carboxylase carboxyl transferase subunit alpha
MFENAIYSVISPEGCATILWKDPKKTLEASAAMKLSSKDLLELSIIDEIIEEPLGGAHRDKELMVKNLELSIKNNLNQFNSMSRDEILAHRKNKFLLIGRNKTFSGNINTNDSLAMKEDFIQKFILYFSKFKYQIVFVFILIIFSLLIFLR